MKYPAISQPGHLMPAAIVAAIPDGPDRDTAEASFAACYANGLAAGTPVAQQDQYVFTLNIDSEPTSVSCTVTRSRVLPS